MATNLGQTKLKRRKRQGDPMDAYDALPTPLRQWLANASMPWSPASARKVWIKAQAKGYDEQEALQFLSKCEVGMLRRDSTLSPAATQK